MVYCRPLTKCKKKVFMSLSTKILSKYVSTNVSVTCVYTCDLYTFKAVRNSCNSFQKVQTQSNVLDIRMNSEQVHMSFNLRNRGWHTRLGMLVCTNHKI